jgi:hypothetical protein
MHKVDENSAKKVIYFSVTQRACFLQSVRVPQR